MLQLEPILVYYANITCPPFTLKEYEYYMGIEKTEGVVKGCVHKTARKLRAISLRRGSIHTPCETRSSELYMVPVFEARRAGEFQDARLPRACCADGARCADVAEKGAEMTQTRCGNNLQAFGGRCFAPSQTGHRRAIIGRHQRVSGGKTAHEGNAPQSYR
ncbi:hypothetical protein BJV77DRAFT_213286 [Russula vinacea]|nr:hypothetical protein BJV77DRAFT_213286 [Russula vinacea]